MSTIFWRVMAGRGIGAFFEGGGAAHYHSPIQPQGTQSTCQGWGSWSNFEADRDYNISGYTGFYFAAHMINLEWVAHRSGIHRMFPSSVGLKDSDGNALVTSYAVNRPDGNWSLMLVNRDESNPHTVKVAFEDSKSSRARTFTGPVTLATFGSEQYVWKDDGQNSRADPGWSARGFHHRGRSANHFYSAQGLHYGLTRQSGGNRTMRPAGRKVPLPHPFIDAHADIELAHKIHLEVLTCFIP